MITPNRYDRLHGKYDCPICGSEKSAWMLGIHEGLMHGSVHMECVNCGAMTGKLHNPEGTFDEIFVRLRFKWQTRDYQIIDKLREAPFERKSRLT